MKAIVLVLVLTATSVSHAGSIYVSEHEDNTIYEIDGQGQRTVFYGSSAADPLLSAFRIVGDGGGGLYAVDFFPGPSRILNITAPDTATVYLEAGGIPPFLSGDALFNDLALGPDGNLYVSVRDHPTNQRGGILKVTSTGVASWLYKHTGNWIYGLAVRPSDGTVFVNEASTNVIIEISPQGIASTFVHSGPLLKNVQDMVFGPNGDLYVADSGGTNGVVRIDSSGVGSVFYDAGNLGPTTPNIEALNFALNGDLLAADNVLDALVRISPSGVGTILADGFDNLQGVYEVEALVPLPSAALAGLGLIGAIALVRRMRRRSL